MKSGDAVHGVVLDQGSAHEASCVKIASGQLHIDSAGRLIPEFLLDANQAIGAGCPAEAQALLCENNLKQLGRALEQDPSRIDLLYMLVKLLLALGWAEQAEPWGRRILELEPSHVAWFHMALIYRGLPDATPQALYWARRAFEARPNCGPYVDVYARCLVECDLVQETLDLLDELSTNQITGAPVLEEILALLLHSGKSTRSDLMRGYGILGRSLTQGIEPRTAHGNDPDPHRRIRVGFISPDLRRNSTAIPFEVFLDGVDHAVLEIYAYGQVACPDNVTRRIQRKVDQYFDIAGMSSDRVAALIGDHGVDILVTLGGYVHDHRLEVMAYKPAPVQVDFGWVTTTGLPVIDYRVTDDVVDPVQTAAYHVEKLAYLPGGLPAFMPPASVVPLNDLPAKQNGFITFGSFHRNCKIPNTMIALWGRMLRALPDSRLIIKSPQDTKAALESRFHAAFARLGIDGRRIDCYGALAYQEYLEVMRQVDLALDTYPFNGCITTLEGLWMGIPIITLTGQVHTARVGYDLLHRLDLELFSATTTEEYLAKACSFASQIDSLAQIRQSLRGRMLNSPLCDPMRLAREMEACFRRMWQCWCENTRFHPRGQVSSVCLPGEKAM